MALDLAKDDYSGWNEAFLNVGYGIFPDWEDFSFIERSQKIFDLEILLQKNRKKYRKVK